MYDIKLLNFIGSTKDKDTLENTKVGDVCIESDSIYVKTTTDIWQKMETDIYAPVHLTEIKEMLPKICKCCGAPLRGWKCEYCGVEYD